MSGLFKRQARHTPTTNKELLARADLIIEIASPEMAAQKLGWSVDAVLKRRKELGLPEPEPTWVRQERKRKGLSA